MLDPIFKKQGALMNSNEIELFKLLKEAVGSEYLIVPQVHFEKLIDPDKFIGNKKFAVGHVSRWSVDFGLFDLKTFLPLLAIELNGYSHDNPKTEEKDEEKRRHLEESGLPLLVFQNYNLPSSQILTKLVREKINQ